MVSLDAQPTICPYPGLRSFNEAESIYFKGRELQVEEIIDRLTADKFVMVTGASGDGKSSLIFAGVVPNCRAGFFKAKFSNWVITSFRPERTPLRNLAAALAPYTVNTESVSRSEAISSIENSLQYGYSSLIDVYKESELFFDTNSPEWLKADETQKKNLKRKAANLLIIVDQFEEFFTNPENFDRITSTAAESTQVIVSLLLETIQIAKEQDIPIYIVCTMRSDYLGQCAALRGFPEKIEESLFFLPRLTRKDIVQVIQEPAVLSGNSITERLIQRLLNDTHGGIDILPVLQHCLSRIWHAADKGNETMDMIHYAMVGGIKGEHLPEENKEGYHEWYEQQPESRKKHLQNPSLANVLNMHADELYESANQQLISTNVGNNTPLTIDQRKFIIETTFKCLTKIDDNRAIRNIMSLDEIAEMAGYDPELVAEVIKPFRIHGNTLIRPFLTNQPTSTDSSDDESTEADQPGAEAKSEATAGKPGHPPMEDPPLANGQDPETVLDITHEALIRNWKLLEKWTQEEYADVLAYREMLAQFDRWTSNNKSKKHLLSAGLFDYFINWFDKKKPDAAWINRYIHKYRGETDKITVNPPVSDTTKVPENK